MGHSFSILFPSLFGAVRAIEKSPLAKLPKNEILIALVGVTGSGMSQLIHDATGAYAAEVAPEERMDDEPFTTEIKQTQFTIHGVNFADFPLVFIDTPGFDFHRHNNEYTALISLAQWLEANKPNTQLHGLIYMHNIWSEDLHRRPPFNSPDILEKLCGQDWPKKVILVNSHWNQRENPESRMPRIEKYWEEMSHEGSTMERYEACKSSTAWRILRPLVKNAEAAREESLKGELNQLKRHLSDEVRRNVTRVLAKKAQLIRGAISRLGESPVPLTQQEKQEYDAVQLEAVSLWKQVEDVITLEPVELRQRLASGR